MEKIYLFMADGTEECEALIVLDILRRASVNVFSVSINSTNFIETSHNIKIECDLNIKDLNEDDGICFIIPGGTLGVKNLYGNDKLKKILKKAYNKNKILCAICAGPSIFGKLGILKKSKQATCYPSFEKDFKEIYISKKVVVDNNIITARSLGSSFEFAFEILEKIKDSIIVEKIKESIHFNIE